MRSLVLAAFLLLANARAVAQVPFSGCGDVVQGVTCVLFSPDAGGVYVITSAPGPFQPGDRLFVTGTIDTGCFTFCLQGNGCIDMTTMGPCNNSGSAFCASDGTFADHTTACPCGNTGATGNGCAHSFSVSGGNLTASGDSASDTVVLEASGLPVTSFTLFLQHDSPGDTVFHDGVLCASGALIRLRGRSASGGAASFPNSNFANDSTITLSQRGGVTVGSGAQRFYSAWYRNASSTFCPPATANVTNGWQITW